MTLRAIVAPIGMAVALVALLRLVSPWEPAQAAPGPSVAPGLLTAWGAPVEALRPETRRRVLEEADKVVDLAPRPVRELRSAGADDLGSAEVVATRAAFEDADDTLILALAWQASGNVRYCDAALRRLSAWASTNVPTGHPIDETRLDALVHAYQLMRSALPPDRDAAVRSWFSTMRDRKRAWRFGPKTSLNNHRTHQLKMLVLLDRALGDEAELVADRAASEVHAARNLDAGTGESVDLRERGALYYHTYTLDAWLEIVLATRCCKAPVAAAYQLLERRLLAGDIESEFEGSSAPLDAARARAGFGYGAAGSTFDPRRAEHAILSFYTLEPDAENPFAHGLAAAQIDRRNLYTFARYESWKR